MSSIDLGDILDTIRKNEGLEGYVNWEDWRDLAIIFLTEDETESLSCLSIHGCGKDPLYISIGKKES